MSNRFSLIKVNGASGPALWLQIAAAALAALNLVAVYLYLVPPGGSRRDLVEQEASIRRTIQLHRAGTERLRTVSTKVQLGAEQTDSFSRQYFLPHRTAFAALLDELLRLSTKAALHEGQRTFSQEPIEGTDDLTLLTINANYQGNYSELMHFVNEVDHSSQLLILDQLTATPQQQGAGNLNIVTRFLAILKDDGSPVPATGGAR